MFFIGSFLNWRQNRKRNIFQYWDGSRWRRADPIVIATALDEGSDKGTGYIGLLIELNKDLSSIPPGPLLQEALAANVRTGKQLAALSRRVFDVKELSDREGLTDAECVKIITQFFWFMEGNARRAEVFQPSPDVA